MGRAGLFFSCPPSQRHLSVALNWDPRHHSQIRDAYLLAMFLVIQEEAVELSHPLAPTPVCLAFKLDTVF